MLPAWLTFEAVKRFLPLILIGLVVLIVGTAVWRYGSSRYDAGVASMKPALTACAAARDDAIQANKHAAAAIKALQTMYGDLDKVLSDLKERELRAHLRAEAALAEAARKERLALQEAIRLKRQLETPSATPQQACTVAQSALQEEAARRSAP